MITRVPAPGAPGTVTSVLNSVQVGGAYSGSVPEGQMSATPIALSLADAIARGLKTNLGGVTSSLAVQQARATNTLVRSALLPNVTGRVSETVQRINLAAFGFHVPGFPNVVGPFPLFDARGAVSYNLFDLTSIRNYRATNENIRSAELNLTDARDTIALAVTGGYLQVIAAAARVDAAQAQVEAGQAIYQQAIDRHRNGLIARIDEVRPQVELQVQQQRLTAARADFARQKLALGRLIGLPPGQDFTTSDQVPFVPLESVTIEEALRNAMTNRADLRAAESQVKAAELVKSAARAERYPSFGLNGDFGVLGQHASDTAVTYTAAAGLRIPIFEGGRIRGDIEQADTALQQRRAELADVRGRVDFDVRTAFLDVQAAADQVNVARSNVELARETLTQSQDRFRAGVADSVEVVQAQELLAKANEDYINALYSHNISKASLARATGLVEETLKRYFNIRGK